MMVTPTQRVDSRAGLRPAFGRRGRPRLGTAVLVAAMMLAAGVLAAPVAAAQSCPTIDWVQPVDGVPVDRFRPPQHIGAPGNRGWEFRAVAGSPVRASGPGIVSFAGAIGGDLFVAIVHCGGLRTTYSFLDHIGIGRGDVVAGGQVVGSAGVSMHFGVLRGANYVDPARLFTSVAVQVRLVPVIERDRSRT